VSGFATALDEDYGTALDETGRDYLARIRAAASRMAELIDDLLELSRTTRASIEATDVDVSAMARSIVAGLRRAPGGGADVVIEAGITVWADPRLLRVALENLLGNAWKFTRKTPAPRIEVAVETDERGTAIVVRDNGAGFDPVYASKLFGVFQRLHAPSEFEGTGIGLATVQRIAHKHGGTIEAEGAPGLGATFRLRLPDRPPGAPKGGSA
jgi:signal transduction histidine kinase